MKLKEIWAIIKATPAFLKNVFWPAAKPFICASKEEAAELVLYARNHERIANKAEEYMSLDRDNVPEFVMRCINALEELED